MIRIDSLIRDIIGLGRELIVDKDKAIEFEFKAAELRVQALSTVLQTKTHPWVDAAVKLMYAFQIFWRPLVGTLMTGFGMYCHYKGIQMDTGLHAVFDGAFPAWGVSRHIEKKQKLKKQISDDDEAFSD